MLHLYLRALSTVYNSFATDLESTYLVCSELQYSDFWIFSSSLILKTLDGVKYSSFNQLREMGL